MTKTWTLSELLVIKKTYGPQALRVHPALIRTYLFSALSRHSPLVSGGLVVVIELKAPNTFRSRKRPTSSKRSNMQS